MRTQIERALDVAARQGQGQGFNPLAGDKTIVDSLLAGELTLHPHPLWKIPPQIHWDDDPFGELNWQAQLNMLRWLDPLRRRAEGNDAARAMWLDVVASWIDANLESPRSRWVTEGMVAGIRGIAILNGLPLSPEPERLLHALDRHVDWLADDTHVAVGNHALWQMTGLFVLASALGRDAERAEAVRRFERHMADEYDDEGVNAEGSLAYHLANYRWARDSLRRFELEGVRLPDASARLDGALREILHGTRPDGMLERIGDTERAPLTGVVTPEVQYVRSGGERGEPPQELAAVFSAGYAFGRTGWGETRRALIDETFYSLRFGRADRLHGHQDGGSLTYFAGGGPVLVDTGKYGYNRSEMRQHLSSRRGHNVVDVTGVPYDRSADVALVDCVTSDGFESYALLDEGYADTVLRREVVFSHPGEWLLVADQVDGAPPAGAVGRWHVDDAFTVTLQDGRAHLRRETGSVREFTLTWADVDAVDLVAGEEEPFEGWTATGWNTAVPVPLVRLHPRVGRGRSFMLVAPADDGTAQITVEHGERNVLVAIDVGDRSSWVVFRDGSAPLLSASRPEGWDEPSAAEALVPGSGSEIPLAAIEQAEKIITEARGVVGHPDVDGEVQSAAGRLQALGLDDGWDYGFGSVLADTGVRTQRFRPGRAPLVGPTADYRGSSYPVFRHGCVPEEMAGEPAIHLFELGAVALSGLLVPHPGDVLFVALSGAVDRGRTTLPLFQGTGVHAEFPGPSLFLSDPTLELDRHLRLGWYLGTAGVDVHPAIARVAERSAALLGAREIVLVGGSGGGFAALQVATFLQGSTAVAFSPQTSVTSYHPRFRDHALRAVFGPSGPSTADAARLDATHRYRRGPVRANVHYIQNSGDAFHLDRHVRPFRASLEESPLDGVFRYEEVSMGRGHVSPSRAAYVRAVLDALQRS